MANRFWVGGVGNWDASTTTHWASTSNGAGGQSVPTAADDVFFDLNSNGGTVTVTATANCRSITCTGFTKTLVLSNQTLNVGDASGGALTFVSTMTLTVTNTTQINFVSTSDNSGSGWGITTGGKSIPITTFNGVGGRWKLLDNFTSTNNVGTITLTNGYLDTNGKTCQWTKFFSNSSNTRTLALGASQVTITSGAAALIWDITSSTNMTLSAGTSTLIFNGIAGATSPIIAFGGLTYNSITITGTATPYANVELADNVTLAGTLSVSGNSSTNRFLLASSDLNGIQRTITAAAVSGLANVTFRDISAAGASAPWSGTGFGDALGNSGITFPARQTYYWVGGTGNWSDTTHWASSSGGSGSAGVPLAQDDVVFDANSFSSAGQNVTLNNYQHCRNLDTTGVTNSPTFICAAVVSCAMYGNLSMGACSFPLQSSGQSTLSLRGRNCTITSNGNPIFSSAAGTGNFLFQIIAANGGYSLTDDLNTGPASLRLQAGTFDANNKNVTAASFSNTAQTNRTLNMGSGTWTITTTGGWGQQFATGYTVIPGTATIDFTASSGTTTIGLSGVTYPTVKFSGGGILAIGGASSGTITTLMGGGSNGKTFQFSTGGITNVTNLNINGDASALNFVRSSTSTVQAQIAVTTSSCSFLDVKDSLATGNIPIIDAPGGVDSGNNTGWQIMKTYARMSLLGAG